MLPGITNWSVHPSVSEQADELPTGDSILTSSPLRSELVWNTPLALLLVGSLCLDGSMSAALDNFAGQLSDTRCRSRSARPNNACYSGQHGPLKRKEPHGRR